MKTREILEPFSCAVQFEGLAGLIETLLAHHRAKRQTLTLALVEKFLISSAWH